MHKDKFRTKASNEAYREGYARIFDKKAEETKQFEDVDQETLDAELEAEKEAEDE